MVNVSRLRGGVKVESEKSKGREGVWIGIRTKE